MAKNTIRDIDKKPGIYCLKNDLTGKVYVGSSIDVRKRVCGHFRMLINGKHHSKHLQNSFNKYGKEAFSYSVLEYTDEDMLIEREQYWIDEYSSANNSRGYNICGEAGRTSGFVFSEESKKTMSQRKLGKPLSDSHKKSLSLASKGRRLTELHKKRIGDAHKGMKRSEETCKKMRDKALSRVRRKLTDEEKSSRLMRMIEKGTKRIYPKLSDEQKIIRKEKMQLKRLQHGKS